MGFLWNKGKDAVGPVLGTVLIIIASVAPYLILVAIIGVSIYAAVKEEK